MLVYCVSLGLTKKDRSRVSAEDIRVHEDPRAAVPVRCVSVYFHECKVKKIPVLYRLTLVNLLNVGFCHCLTTTNFSTRKEFRSNQPKPAACKCPSPVTNSPAERIETCAV